MNGLSLGRSNPRQSTFLWTIAALSFLWPAAAFADINAWYELVDSTGPGNGVVNVQQGAAGAPLIIETDDEAGSYEFSIRFVADVDESEAIVSYAVDLIAPNDETVSAVALSFSDVFGFNDTPMLAAGPGVIAERVGQAGSAASGVLVLFEVDLQISEPPAGDVEIFSGIGFFGWITSGGTLVDVVFADADPVEALVSGPVSSTPSIIIRQGQPSQGDDCDADGTSDEEQIAADPSLDCNNNGTLDSCELSDGTSLDCDGNSVPDECDIADGTSPDCNGNSVPDACDISGGTSQDCNSNGVPDECDIATGTSMDANADGIPDECVDTPGGDPVQNPVRTLLAVILDVPSDGWPMMSAIPIALFGILGVPMSVSLFFVELLNLPVRMIIFELLAALLGAGSQ